MPNPHEISSLEELLVHLALVRQHKAKWTDVSFKPRSIIVPIVAHGNGLDRRVDARSAALIKDIQKRADNLFTLYSADRQKKAPLIKVEAKDGSNCLEFDLTEVLTAMVDKLPPEAITGIVVLLIVGGFGLGAFWLWTRHSNAMSQSKLIEKAIDGYGEFAREIFGTEASGVAPIRRYAHTLGNEQTLSVAGSPALVREEAQRALSSKRRRWPVYTVSCDGVYDLTNLGMQHFPPTLGISKDDSPEVDASIKNLSIDMQDFLVDKVKRGLADQTLPQPIELQIDVYFTERERKRIEIVGIGHARSGMKLYSIDDVPQFVDLADATIL